MSKLIFRCCIVFLVCATSCSVSRVLPSIDTPERKLSLELAANRVDVFDYGTHFFEYVIKDLGLFTNAPFFHRDSLYFIDKCCTHHQIYVISFSEDLVRIYNVNPFKEEVVAWGHWQEPYYRIKCMPFEETVDSLIVSTVSLEFFRETEYLRASPLSEAFRDNDIQAIDSLKRYRGTFPPEECYISLVVRKNDTWVLARSYTLEEKLTSKSRRHRRYGRK